MWSFLKKLHLTVFAVGFVIGVVLLIVFLYSIGTGANIGPKSILRIRLDHPIVEHAGQSRFSSLDLPIASLQPKIGVINTVQAIKKAKEDQNISAIFLELRMIDGGLAAVDEIREALVDFKESGKKIIAYGDYMDEKAYYLGSVADSLFIAPEGMMEFNGMVAEVRFYKSLLKSLGIEPQVFRVGRFKSAVEPFLRDSISNENAFQISEFINSLHQNMLAKISVSRHIKVDRLKEISDNLLVRNPTQAVESGMVDGSKYMDEVLEILKNVSGLEEDQEVNFVEAETYWSTPLDVPSSNKIVVIVADGDIGMGQNQEGTIGGNGMSRLIRQVRMDKSVKAVVLRINSPGGSALGSDLMWREIELLSLEKPIIASMSDYAASGGYYMAMACDTIVAHPNTITGSIGVFGLTFTASELIEKKIGVHTDRVKTGKFSDIGTPTRSMTPQDSAIIQQEVNTIYSTFIRKAAKGRNMSEVELEKVASGRVWSGAMAREKGLVDVFGGLDRAIEIAAQKAGITNYTPEDIAYYPELNPLFGNIESTYRNMLLPKELKLMTQSELYQYLTDLQKLDQMKGIQARAPFELRIK